MRLIFRQLAPAITIALGVSGTAIAQSAAPGPEAAAAPATDVGNSTKPVRNEQESASSDTIYITASRISQLGVADSANEGIVTGEQLNARTVYRPGELLEATPGLIVSQHSGEGKANQFYLRGFNLDHGTDLRTTIDGMLVNQRSHGHGQGWTDVNFLIPELADRLTYRKGTYSAEDGDFAAAGSVGVSYVNKLPRTLVSLGVGENGYRRGLIAGSPAVGAGNLLYALELFHNDGPFNKGDDFRKFNAVLRYSQGDDRSGFNVTAMAYKASYNATDQIPKRAVDAGTLDRFSSIDPTDGGKVHRYSLSAAWHRTTESSATRINAYIIDNRLRIYSNFTYFLDDPINGDQFAQPDDRTSMALNASQLWKGSLFGRPSETSIGLQLQRDSIRNGLLNTKARQTLSVTRRDRIKETSVGGYIENLTRWTDKFRTVLGLRGDYYDFDVRSSLDVNSGTSNDFIASPKLSLIFGPWSKTEFYLNLGTGFHSNDARGTTIRIDPKSGDPADRVPGLVRAKGAELGVRTEIVPRLQTTLSVYGLDFDSELTFAGDAGTTSAGRPSRRVGFELSNYYKPTDWLTIDADIAFARARFRGSEPEGQRIPGAIEGVASLALAVDNLGPYFGALQFRYFGPRPLIEDNSVRSKATTTLNGRVGYRFKPTLSVELEAFNLLNSKSSAIDYYYQSRLPDEGPDGQEDIHFHPIESRSLRVTFVATL
ncbi:TonB-dependent receptor domain-containing protein [Sphingomonas sp.]|uniref:TonB-dependent receptor n=1 Tax=Sphingomonas sp. TaxID=28214 RepID=UPI00286C7111|nr:TonB-dependent receptor [Sphingomonas sp.]